jgi:hypothetical protein
MRRPHLLIAMVAIAVVGVERAAVDAHKTIASKYTFNRDVRPILDRRCSQCHAADAALPLQTYAQVRAQSWPLRQSLASGRMPPYFAEPGDVALKDPQTLSPRELDVLMTWASGGTPEGAAVPVRASRTAPTFSASAEAPAGHSFTVTAAGIRLEQATRIVAVRSIEGPAGAEARLFAVAPDGSRRHLIDVRIEPRWPRRYELARPVALAAASRIEAVVTPARAEFWRPLLGGPPRIDGPIAEFRAVVDVSR